jgi:hypothetical protein
MTDLTDPEVRTLADVLDDECRPGRPTAPAVSEVRIAGGGRVGVDP